MFVYVKYDGFNLFILFIWLVLFCVRHTDTIEHIQKFGKRRARRNTQIRIIAQIFLDSKQRVNQTRLFCRFIRNQIIFAQNTFYKNLLIIFTAVIGKKAFINVYNYPFIIFF